VGTANNEFRLALKGIADQFYGQLRFKPVMKHFATGDVSRVEYVTFLRQSYHYVQATTPNLNAAAASVRQSSSSHRDDISARFLEHAADEQGHDEWILDDLEALGEDRAAVHDFQPCTAVRAYLAYSHHLARSRHAVALFGQAYVLEGGALESSDYMVRGLIEHSGIPNIADGVKYLRLHGEVDIEHVQALGRALDWVTEPEDQYAVRLAAEFTSQVILDLVDYVETVSVARV